MVDINPEIIIAACTGIVENALKTKSREFNRTLFRMENDRHMIILIKLCLMNGTEYGIQNILNKARNIISYTDTADYEIIMSPFHLEPHVSNQINGINKSIRRRHSPVTIGIIHVHGIIDIKDDGAMSKPKYVFSAIDASDIEGNPRGFPWLLLVDYSKILDKSSDPAAETSREHKSQLAILSNKTRIFYTEDEVADLLRKYKIDTKHWNTSDLNPEPIHRKYSKTPLAAGKFSRLKHAVGKRVHKVMKKVARARNKTVSLSKSKGTFTRIRVEPKENAKEVMTLIKAKYPEALNDEIQPASTKWGKFREHVGWLTKDERARKQYLALSEKPDREQDEEL